MKNNIKLIIINEEYNIFIDNSSSIIVN